MSNDTEQELWRYTGKDECFFVTIDNGSFFRESRVEMFYEQMFRNQKK